MLEGILPSKGSTGALKKPGAKDPPGWSMERGVWSALKVMNPFRRSHWCGPTTSPKVPQGRKLKPFLLFHKLHVITRPLITTALRKKRRNLVFSPQNH